MNTETVEMLVSATLNGCKGEVEVRLGEAAFAIPCSQLPEAWANLIHVYCLNDYQLDSLVKLRPGSIVVDGGAYLGFFTTRIALAMKRRGLVIAVEPNPFARKALYRNLELNGLENIARVDPRALSGCEYCIREIHITEPWGNTSMYTRYIDVMGVEFARTLRIPAISLRRLFQDLLLRSLDVEFKQVDGAYAVVLEQPP